MGGWLLVLVIAFRNQRKALSKGVLMSVSEYLGYAKALLDSYGLTGVITAVVIIMLAYTVYSRFFGARE